MKNELNISDFEIGEYVIDTYNEFNDPKFKFIKGQKHDPSLGSVEIVEKTSSSICVRLKAFPLRIMKKDGGGISKPLSNYLQWFKFKREHEDEIGFTFRFKKQ